jgi:repressor LexA
MQTISLTPAQEKTFSFLKSFIAKRGEGPTIVELRKEFKLRSLRSVTQRLEGLEKKGLIKRDRFQHRSIGIVGDAMGGAIAEMVKIPVISSAGCDAVQVYAEDEFGEYILVDKKMVNVHTNLAAIKAVGDSMQDAGIRNGDYVIVEVTDTVENGDRVVAVLGNMAVIKQYSKTDGVVYLNPQNKEAGYHTIVVKEEDSKIFGKVVSVIPGTEWVDDVRIEYYDDDRVNNEKLQSFSM